MQKEIKLNNNDLLIMNLVHYFITEKNYNPVILHGITDEIWLENMDGDYKLIRIVSRYIHNNEQLSFDRFKLNKIVNNLKKKTFSWKLPTISIYTSLGEDVNLSDNSNNLSLFVNKISDVDNKELVDVFPDIVEKTSHEEKGVELFVKISEDINKESFENSKKVERVFARKEPVITYALLVVCIFLYVFLGFSSGSLIDIDSDTLVEFGGNIGYFTKSGEYFRLFCSIFLHGNIMHLIFNMYSLYVIGPQVESFFGKFKYIFIFVFSGVVGSLLSLAFNPGNVVSVGASGALFGILGSICYFGYHYRVYFGNILKSQIIPIIMLNLLLGFMSSGIDNFAHIGGLIGGIFASMAVGIPEKSGTSDKANGCVLLLIYLIFLIYFAFFMNSGL